LTVASGCELLLVVAASVTGGASFEMAATPGGAGWEFVGGFESFVEADAAAAAVDTVSVVFVLPAEETAVSGDFVADGAEGKGCAAAILAASFAVLRESFEAPGNSLSNELSGEAAGAVIAFEATVLLFGIAAVGKACSRVVSNEVVAVAEGSDGGVTLPLVVPTTAAAGRGGGEPAELVGLMLLAADRALSFGFIWPAAAVLTGGTVPVPGEPALGKTVPCCRLP
jgi:hypothetical protein